MAYSYVAQKGDTWHRIARRAGVPVGALLGANPRLDGAEPLVPGEVLAVPDVPSRRYVVQPGDTFSYVSRRFNITPEDLLAANPSVNPLRLTTGHTLTFPRSRGMQIVSAAGPYGFFEMMEDLELLLRRYPFLEIKAIGASVLGKVIPAVKLGRGANRVHYNGAFHANEWITTPLLMRFIEEYAEAVRCGFPLRGRCMTEAFERTSLWIVPMVNPDGVELVQEGITPRDPYFGRVLQWNKGSFDFSRWKANIRGVDLNDQYPAHWQEEKQRRAAPGPGPRDYPGAAPLTEPEAVAEYRFTMRNDFRLAIAFHTQGREFYWNYRDMEPPEAEAIASRFAAVSGYKPVRLTGSDAGYKDWFIKHFRRPGFTVEAGEGVNPLALTQFPAIYEEVAGIMIEGLFV